MSPGTDRHVPGLSGVLELVAPETWTRVAIEIDETPPSMNNNQIRSHWRGFHTEKKRWQERLQQELMVSGAPRDNSFAVAGAILRFPRLTRRDSGNYSSVLEKALGDALIFSDDKSRPTNLRYIADDDAKHFHFAGVEFEGERGPHRTRVVLFLQPQEV